MLGKATPLTPRASAQLDMIRGLAAVAVMVGHVRGLFLADYSPQLAPGRLLALFYMLTGLGHEAVMVFFVLSGFFIGGSVLATVRRWSWTRYLVNRLTRLYLVLIPALVLTAILDYFGYRQPGGHVYFDLPIPHFTIGPMPGRGSWIAFFGNILFLQNLRVPAFGSSLPLQTVGTEFWFYILFPAFTVAIMPGGSAIASMKKGMVSRWLLPLILIVWLPRWMFATFTIWLMGAAVDLLPQVTPRAAARLASRLGSFTIFAVSLLLSRAHRLPDASADYIIGATFAFWLWSLAKIASGPAKPSRAFSALAHLLSRCSYSVYAVHFPIAMFARTALGTTVWPPTPGNLAIYSAGCLCIFLLGLGFSRLTEAHTAAVRGAVLRLVSPAIRPLPAASTAANM